MPSDTFFRLPAEKRERLLRCARAEFARVPYPEASINRIILAAGIPRGSYYMYFADKSDLFAYLTSQYIHRFSSIVTGLLREREGDLFRTFLDLFDHLQAYYRAQGRDGTLEEIIAILRQNAVLPHVIAVGEREGRQVLSELLAHVDTAPLLLEREGDAEDLLHILAGVTIPLLCQGLTQEDPSEVRAKYVNVLEILKRGMLKASPAAVS